MATKYRTLVRRTGYVYKATSLGTAQALAREDSKRNGPCAVYGMDGERVVEFHGAWDKGEQIEQAERRQA